MEALYRVARGMCGSREDAEDLVQDTFARLLSRPRFIRSDDDRGYLIRALHNTQVTRYRAALRGPRTVPLLESHWRDRAFRASAFDARELMAAIAAAPKLHRDAVLAVDVVGLSYRQAACQLRTREATITTRLHRGRRHVVQALGERAIASSWGS
jgi:RNA polymerase sigma-70 factor (ECF subfamily)